MGGGPGGGGEGLHRDVISRDGERGHGNSQAGGEGGGEGRGADHPVTSMGLVAVLGAFASAVERNVFLI